MENSVKYFGDLNQYINWFSVPDINTGKPDKIPFASVSDPGSWTSYENAVAQNNRYIGFVFSASDPFFFVDIDHCINKDGVPTEFAKYIISLFPGCLLEYSYSRTGIHVYGIGSWPINRRNKNSDFGIEVYDRERFTVLSGYYVSGSAYVNGQAGLNELHRLYFPDEKFQKNTDWTDSPCPDWDGEIDDKKLIDLAIKTKSAEVAFGGKISFKELYEADQDALCRFFPKPDGGFDWSAADAALAAHLAFYTGKNCERMEKLFSTSKLADRQKWQDREDYRQRTILNAVNVCKTVFKYQKRSETDTPKIGSSLMTAETQQEYFRNCVYVISLHKVFTEKFGLLRPDQFKTVFGGQQFLIDRDSKPVRNAFEVFTESRLLKFPKVFGVCFRPELPATETIVEEGLTYVNTYVPARIRRVAGDVSFFIDLITRLLPDQNDQKILVSYMAACVQHVGYKFRWAPILQGVEGNGKTFLKIALSKAVGERYSYFPNPMTLTESGLKFNGWLFGKLLIGIDELCPDNRDLFMRLMRSWITDTRIEYQKKGENQFTGDNRANFFMCTNFKDAVRKTVNDRRYSIFYTAQQKFEDLKRDGMTEQYFKNLYDIAEKKDGYAVIAEFLHTYKIEDAYNPAVFCQRAPVTSSTQEAFASSLSPIEYEILEAVQEGRMGFKGGWISSAALDILLAEKGYRIPLRHRKILLEGLGYEVKERASGESIVDRGRRPVLYIKSEMSELKSLKAGKISLETYINAQQ